jgi:hypothetical protein
MIANEQAEQWLLRFQQGDKEALEHLYLHFKPMLYSFPLHAGSGHEHRDRAGHVRPPANLPAALSARTGDGAHLSVPHCLSSAAGPDQPADNPLERAVSSTSVLAALYLIPLVAGGIGWVWYWMAA